MQPPPKFANLIRFGVFEADIQTGELTKRGRSMHIQEQPFRILIALLERPGELITREELQEVLWPDGVNVDFDHGLNVSVKKLREALGDSAASPRYIETLPRRGYRFIAPVEPLEVPERRPARAATRADMISDAPSPRRWIIPVVLLLGLAITAAAIAWWSRYSRIRWARFEAPPRIERLVEQGRFYEAFLLARRAARYVPADFHLRETLNEISAHSSISTSPEGAEIHMRDYMTPDAAWDLLGETPLDDVPIPISYFRFRITKQGFEPLEGAVLGLFSTTAHFDLQPAGSVPSGMVFVPGGRNSFGAGPEVDLGDFWMDRYEVTNRQFQAFVKAGGYDKPEYWQLPFVRDGRTIPWQEAVMTFCDRTGRRGPATWELGRFPEGTSEEPVSGVSWYEAAAFAEFAAKRLPTVYHWSRAAGIQGRGQGVLVDLRPLSNFAGGGLSAVGSFDGLSPYGAYDMGGNVKEWCWNEVTGRRFILGGAWSEPPYMFGARESVSPWARSATHGFRCMKAIARVSPALLARVPADALSRNVAAEQPVGDTTFAQYLRLYSYDRTELNAVVESVEDRHPDWRRERVSFDAAYGDERVPAYLYLPRNAAPPYQCVIHYPGGEAYSTESSRHLTLTIDYIIRSGRAVMLPIFKGHYERQIDRSRIGKDFFRSFAARDLIVQQSKDLGRSIDYLETRPDIDTGRLAYSGISAGAGVGPILTAVEHRFRASVLLAGGLGRVKRQPEAEPLNFAPRATVPVMMINGRDDSLIPLETRQLPLFRLLGAPAKDKRHALFDSGHIPPRLEIIREVLDWLDRYLGPVTVSGTS